jgi:aryl-alcohol dehydrogenase-like predicted oxidoreductase
MGCAGIGGDLYYRNDRQSLDTLRAARDHGVTFFDTANVYGYGRSEALIGKAFRRDRERVVIATKGGVLYPPMAGALLRLRPALTAVGRLLRPYRRRLLDFKRQRRRLSFAPKDLTASVHASLRRLRTDYIDLYQLHHWTPSSGELGELCACLDQLRTAGKIRHYGVSCDSPDDALVALRHEGIASIQLPLSLLDRQAISTVLPATKARGVGFIGRTPLARGLLADDLQDAPAEWLTPDKQVLEARRRRAAALDFLVRPDRTLAQAALRFAVQQDGVATVIVGMRTREHLRSNLASLQAPPLSEAELRRLSGLRPPVMRA